MKKLIYILLAVIVVTSSACDRNKVKNAGELNTKASLPASLNFTSLGYKVITSSINKKLGTMATLYGNKQALADAITGNGGTKPGEEFALITWKQQDDERWYGAKIPGELQSIERVKTGAEGVVDYKCFDGKDIVPHADTLHNAERTKYILSQQASVMP